MHAGVHVGAARSLVIVVASLSLVAFASAGEPPFVHVQTDRPAYRLGDTVRWRVFRKGDEPVSLALTAPDGTVAARAEAKGATPSGTLEVDEDLLGGAWRLVATCGGAVVHEVPLELFDVRGRQLDLSLVPLQDVVYPGEPLVAAFHARALDGTPLAGVTGKLRASFGSLVVEAPVGPTDAEGGAVVRFQVPANAVGSTAHLAVGVSHKKAIEAVARPLFLSASVGRIDCFPEGGAIVAGSPGRVALLVRDLDGRPVAAEGRVEDDQGRVVDVFLADRRGLALVTVPFEKERTYRLRVDRPAGIATPFPLPGPTGHARAVRVERTLQGLSVHVQGKPGRARVELVIDGATEASADETVPEDRPARFGLGFGRRSFAVAHVVVSEKGRATHVVPVLAGQGWEAQVTVAPRGKPRAGAPLVLDLSAKGRDGRPIAADVSLSVAQAGFWTETGAAALALPVRELLHRHAPGAPDAAELFASEALESLARRDALLLVHAARVIAPEGVPVADARALDPTSVPRVTPDAMAPRPAPTPSGPVTAEKPTALDRALRRASFTRAADPRREGAQVLEPVTPRAVAARPRGREAPQDERVPAGRVDRRDVVCWAPAVRVGSDGKASVTLEVGDELGELAIVAQGLGGGAPLGCGAVVAPAPPFEPRCALPARLNVGDVFELEVEVFVTDGSRDPLAVQLSLPAGVRALAETGFEHVPGKSPKVVRLRCEATGAGAGTIGLIATRGALRLVRQQPLEVGFAALSRSTGRSGWSSGSSTLVARVPASAVPGSVVARAQVRTSSTASALDGLDAMLREPYGCFEQTTSVNDPNLAVLEALITTGGDATLLRRAWELADKGYARLLEMFSHPSGGFVLFPCEGAEPQTRYTALAVWQLGRYARLAQGRGLARARQALAWLDQNGKGGTETKLAALASIEAGIPWEGAAAALAPDAAGSPYATALRAQALLLRGMSAKDELAALRQAMAPDGRVHGEKSSTFGSWGQLLDVEVTAHAASAFALARDLDSARRAREFIAGARQAGGGWGSTQPTVQALRALARLDDLLANQGQAVVPVTLSAGNTTPALGRVGVGAPRSLALHSALATAPGNAVELSLSTGGEVPVDWTLECSWRESTPVDSPAAPYRIRTTLPAVGRVDGELDLEVELDRVGETKGRGQIVARVALPGGCAVRTGEGAPDSWRKAATRVEVEAGQLTFYWAEPPQDLRITIPLVGTTAGSYTSGPSVVAPYYEQGCSASAPGHALKVVAAFDLERAAADLRGR